MATVSNNETAADSRESDIIDHSDLGNRALDEVFAEMSTLESPRRPVNRPIPRRADPSRQGEAQVEIALPRREPVSSKPHDPHKPDWTGRVLKGLVLCCAVFAAVSFYRAPPSSPVPRSSSNLAVRAERRLQTIGIQDVRLGDRLAGHNPIREQAENVEPDPATWRAISLRMTKESGNGLWIELLRPVEWIERHEAEPGVPVYLELHEMGAVGDAEVTDIGPCPTIQPGDGGAVVTGTFKHEADENTDVVHLKLEGQIELTGVTDNHAYWSADRRDFVEVGKLRVGELVDTEYGERRIVSVTPIDYTGYLYNLETTEYVYRVGSAGTLVHNKCAPNRKYDGPEHHIASNKDKVFKPLFQKLFQKAGLSLNSPWNRMRLRGHVGPHGKYYNDLVYRRLRDAVGSRTGAAAERALIAELKAIRRDIRHNGWDALLKSRASGVDVRGEF